MAKNPDLGNAFLDVALVGIVLTTVGMIIDLIGGGPVRVWFIALAIATYVVYIVGALRLGTSPVRYLRTVYKRGSLPR